MKKILSLGIASAVLAMTALSASAGVVVKSTDDITPGATIKVEFVLDSDASAISFNTKASGLTLVDASTTLTGMAVVVSDTKDRLVAVGVGAKSGDTVLTQTYTVTAKAGEAISVNVEALEGVTGTATPLTVVVKDATTSDTSSTTSGDTSSTNSGDTSSTTSSTTSTTDPGKNPPTGVALAVFPAVIAGAAVVVAKKKRG